jgi:hypothetical protein
MKRRLAALALLTGLLAVAPALATMGVGVSATTHARGAITDKVKVKEARNTDFVTQQITIAPGGHTGWHTHPGAVLVTVKAGTFAYVALSRRGGDDDDDDDDDRGGSRCTTRIFTAGQSFIDPGHGHVHIGRNVGTTPVELWATYTGVPIGGAFRIDAPDPGC